MSAPTGNEVFEILDGSYSVPDIQDYFEINQIRAGVCRLEH